MRKFAFLALFVLVLAFPLLAQEAKTIDVATAELIVATGIMGFSVIALTEMIKRLLNAQGVLAYAISGVVSAGATLTYLLTTSGFKLDEFIIYSILVFLIANGFYKFVRKVPS